MSCLVMSFGFFYSFFFMCRVCGFYFIRRERSVILRKISDFGLVLRL